MVIFSSYVSLQEGVYIYMYIMFFKFQMFHVFRASTKHVGHNSSILLSGLSISGDLGALPRSIEALELSGYRGYGLLRVIL